MKQQLFGPAGEQAGCPIWENPEVIEVMRGEDRCTNRWNYERFVRGRFPKINTNKDKLEARHFLGNTGEVPPMIFSCPCEPGTHVPLLTQGGYSEQMGFAYWKLEAELEACEIKEFVDVSHIAEQTSIPYEEQPFGVKWLGHQQKYITNMNASALNRYEVMASTIRYYGAYKIIRDKADSSFMNFGKSPCTTIVMKSNYGDMSTYPKHDLDAIKMHFMTMNRGLMPTEGTIGMDALRELQGHHQYRKIGLNCECSEPGDQFDIAAGLTSACGISFAGTWGNIPLWLDARTHIDPATGRQEYYFPQDAVLLSNETDGGQRIREAHTTNYIVPSFPTGDFFFDNGIGQEKNNYWWWATLEGTILMYPENVNRTLMIRGIGRSIAPGPDCPDCVDILLDSEGQIASPQNRPCDPETAEKDVSAATEFEVCAVLAGRTGSKEIPCPSEDDPACIPGDWHQIAPWESGCPDDAKRVVTKDFLIEQGFTEECLAHLCQYGGINPVGADAEAGEVKATPVGQQGKVPATAAEARKQQAQAEAKDIKKK